VPDDCSYTFFPDATWAANHPGCVPDVQWVENCVPTCTLSDCVANDGDVEIGTLMVYEGNFATAKYVLRMRNGAVVTILVDDW